MVFPEFSRIGMILPPIAHKLWITLESKGNLRQERGAASV